MRWWGLELGAFSLSRQNSKVFGNSKLKHDLTGCYKAIFIQVEGYNMFYLTVHNLFVTFKNICIHMGIHESVR